MDSDLSIEKGIAMYLMMLNGVDSMVTWGISCFVAQEFGVYYVALFAGMIGSAFAMGKLAGNQSVEYLVARFRLKWVLIALFFVKACAVLAFGFASNFLLVLVCRFVSGAVSNSQFAIRKLLLNIDWQLKEMPGITMKKALIAFKIGGVIAVVIFGFLTSCQDFMPESSQFVKKKFLLASLFIFLLDLSGVLLVFSIEAKEFSVGNTTGTYLELSERKENKEENEVNEVTEKQSKEKSDLANFLQSSVLANEHLASEESVGIEEVKYFSPRKQSFKEPSTRNIQSARTKPETNFSFQEIATEAKEHERPEGEGKRTHISFIEEELEIIEEVSKKANVEQSEPVHVEKKQENLLDFAIRCRVLLTIGTTLVSETVPVSVYLALGGENYTVAIVLTCAVLFGVVGYYVVCEKIMVKYSVSLQMLRITLALFGMMAIFPLFVFFGLGIGLVVFWTAMMFGVEAVLCVGNVMISDSVANSEREVVMNRNNFYCILSKGIVCVLANGLVGVVECQAAFSFFALVFGALYWMARKTVRLYPNIAEAPYKL